MAIAQEIKIREQKALKLSQAYIKSPIDSVGDDNGEDSNELDSLDGLVRGHSVGRVETKRRVKTKQKPASCRIMPVLKQFNYIINKNWGYYEIYYQLRNTSLDVLTPNEIKAVFQAMLIEIETNPKYSIDDEDNDASSKTGVFVSMLIQASYDAGYNNFELVTKEAQEPISHIGYRLKGKKKRLINIMIDGDATDLCKFGSYCEIYVDGTVDSYGNGAIQMDSHHCVFTIRGDVPNYVGKFYAKNSIYKTSNKKALSGLITNVCHGSCNKIVFINSDGSEDVVLKYNYEGDLAYIDERYHDFVISLSDKLSGSLARIDLDEIEFIKIKKGKLHLTPIA